MLAAQTAGLQAALRDRRAQAGDRDGSLGIEDGDELDEGHRLVRRPGRRQRAAVDAGEGIAARGDAH
jgi:hypothetical protein